MNKTEYNRLSSISKIKWWCTRTDCVSYPGTPIAQFSAQMNTVLSKLDDLLSKVNKIDDISKDIAELRAEVSAVSNCLSTLEPRVASVENKVDSISHNLAIVSSTVDTHGERLAMLEGNSSSDSCVVSTSEEINERNLRAKNIMVFGLGESTMGTTHDRIEDDKANLQSIFSAIDPSLEVNSFKLFRVGKGSRNKPRPITVIVGCEDSVRMITRTATREFLRGLGDNFTGVSISRDRARKEAEHLKNLRAELSRRSDLVLLDMMFYRRDRSPLTGGKQDGDGVLIAVHGSFSSSEVLQPDLPVEALCVEVNLTSRCKVVVCANYIPPQAQTRLN
ncbi:hypothetical protein J6590_080147 [Homalodisca vitripennis]|nr:hypothetical protein J6590_080147 [Homalodisca vitripennis]